MGNTELPPLHGRDRNWSWAFSGSYFLLTVMIIPIMWLMPVSDVAFIALGFTALVFLVLAIQHASTTLTYTPTTLRCTRILDVTLDRRSYTAAPVQLDRLASVSYWDTRDMELRIADDAGNLARIDVSTRWPRAQEWGTLVRTWAERRRLPLTDAVVDVLEHGGARWIKP